jgi:hypothetical protein
MSIALHNDLQGLKEEVKKIQTRLFLQADEIDWLKSEIDRLQKAKRPDRPPIRVPKMPRALQSIGVGLVKG